MKNGGELINDITNFCVNALIPMSAQAVPRLRAPLPALPKTTYLVPTSEQLSEADRRRSVFRSCRDEAVAFPFRGGLLAKRLFRGPILAPLSNSSHFRHRTARNVRKRTDIALGLNLC
jgi:hypothetical protein